MRAERVRAFMLSRWFLKTIMGLKKNEKLWTFTSLTKRSDQAFASRVLFRHFDWLANIRSPFCPLSLSYIDHTSSNITCRVAVDTDWIITSSNLEPIEYRENRGDGVFQDVSTDVAHTNYSNNVLSSNKLPIRTSMSCKCCNSIGSFISTFFYIVLILVVYPALRILKYF